MYLSKLLLYFTAIAASNAQFPPTPKGVTTKPSSKYPGVSVSYKETFLCDTTVRAWAGYVNMPASFIDSPGLNGTKYDANVFFWYFEARNDPQNAPTTLYFAGGPGESSMYGALNDGGPCYVLDDSNTTQHNPWSINTYSNMIYIDQPVGTGFSYDALIKSTLNLASEDYIASVPFSSYPSNKVPAQNSTFYYGILPSSDITKTSPTTVAAARVLWHFSQVWFTEFPHWTTKNKRINLWGNSYGGFYTLIFGQYFLQQNAKIETGGLNGSIILDVDSVGSTNGGIDFLRGWPYNHEYLYNNTYDLQLISAEVNEAVAHNLTKKGGCIDLMKTCRQLGIEYDPEYTAANNTVNGYCLEATLYCFPLGSGLVLAATNRGAFDISHFTPDPSPPNNLAGYLNRAWVQEALGVPVNFTDDSGVVTEAFATSGDFVRAEGLAAMEYLLQAGIRITMISGDRDPDVVWTSAEALTLEARWPGTEQFHQAGYEFVGVNETYKGGFVRQYGGFSFVRVFQSGHDVADFQPETHFQIFKRTIMHTDIATGTQSTLASSGNNSYSSQGPADTWWYKEKAPPPPEFACYIYVNPSCSADQTLALENGTAVIEDWYVVEPKATILPPTGP